ncbi:hypothetical protein PRIPAC_71378 [Pristionchus pacificus]|uniref:Uncharacterized protein n=1 Tax=Pristionchus pacificus TaxID=54126 RepID=A0A2A6B556_PRIPA|nr:hypothetical protein PRIPAC_71378 [Pristionchus pacificus]|eukprot:PDM61017.1 hypothetical protein PRIPAC_54823 [Pristionchus pacificus]
MEIKNKLFNPSIETIKIQVLFALRFYFSIECCRLILTYVWLRHEQFVRF